VASMLARPVHTVGQKQKTNMVVGARAKGPSAGHDS
jgi:hypothetical protein